MLTFVFDVGVVCKLLVTVFKCNLSVHVFKVRPTLLKNMSFTLVIYDFQHRLLTDVESIIVNIG